MYSREFVDIIRKAFVDEEVEKQFEQLDKELEVLDILQHYGKIKINVNRPDFSVELLKLEQEEIDLIEEWLNNDK